MIFSCLAKMKGEGNILWGQGCREVGICLDQQTLCVETGTESNVSGGKRAYQLLAFGLSNSMSGNPSQWNNKDWTRISELRNAHRN